PRRLESCPTALGRAPRGESKPHATRARSAKRPDRLRFLEDFARGAPARLRTLLRRTAARCAAPRPPARALVPSRATRYGRCRTPPATPRDPAGATPGRAGARGGEAVGRDLGTGAPRGLGLRRRAAQPLRLRRPPHGRRHPLAARPQEPRLRARLPALPAARERVLRARLRALRARSARLPRDEPAPPLPEHRAALPPDRGHRRD